MSEKHEDLRNWLTDQDMTQVSLARQIGLDENYVAMICRGERPMSAGFRLRFLTQYGFDPDASFGNGHDHSDATSIAPQGGFVDTP